ncbi:MAG: inorganic phosphate transporter [Desulfobacterales bacterium]|jgi:PiT family inorganic phosphate transporter
MWKLAGGVFVGWSLGSNDAANLFGTGVAAKVVEYRTAIVLTSIFVVIGALLEGYKGMDTVGQMSRMSHMAAFVVAFSAGLCVAIFSFLSLPVSTSQAIMGAVLGIGLISGIPELSRLYKVVLCWIFTPIGAMIFGFALYPLFAKIFNKIFMDLQLRIVFIKVALIFAGCYGAYSLGANNVANVTGVYVGSGLLTPFEAALIGSLSIASGVLTYSRKVMDTIGKKIADLDGFSAFIAGFSSAVTVHLFTQVGVPVSTSQAIVGGVTGVGLMKGVKTVKKWTLVEIAVGWLSTPLSSGIVAYSMMKFYFAVFGTAA